MKKLTKLGLTVGSMAAIMAPVAAVISCGGESRLTAANADLGVWAMKPEQQDQADTVAKEASKDLKYNVGWDMVGGSRDFRAELAAAFAAGKAPTVFTLEKQTDVDSNKDRLFDFNSDAKGAALVKAVGAANVLEANSKKVAIPVTNEAYGTLVNTKLLKDTYKITLAYDTGDNTWITDSMAFTAEKTLHVYSLTTALWSSLFKAISTKAGGAEKSMIFTLKAGSDWVTNHTTNALAGANAGTRAAFATNKGDFAMSFPKTEFEAMAKAYYPYMSTTKSTDDAITLLAGGKTVANQQGSWMQANVAKVSKDIASKSLALLPLPTGSKAAGEIPVGVPQYWGIDKNAGADKIQKGLDFLTWLYTGKGTDDLQNTMQLINPYQKGHEPSSNPILASAAKYIGDKKTYPWVMDMFKGKFNNNNSAFMDAWRTFKASDGGTIAADALYAAAQTAYVDK